MITAVPSRALRLSLLGLLAAAIILSSYVFLLRPILSIEEPGDDTGFEKPVPNPLTGSGALAQTTNLVPLAISIDNLGAARPQTGLESASLVYELPVEGGITRFLAFLLDESITAAGPIRSVRPYFIDLAEEYHAVLIHCGGSPEALARLKAPDARHINQIEEPKGFYRSKDRKAPHNLYGNLGVLHSNAASRFGGVAPQDIKTPWDWGERVDAGTPASSIDIRYWPDYAVGYRMDPSTGQYSRLVNNKPHLSSNRPLAADHVIVQFVDIEVMDPKGRLKVDAKNAQAGRLLVFTRGRMLEGIWTRQSGRTFFMGADQKPIVLSPGLVWVQMVPSGRKVVWK